MDDSRLTKKEACLTDSAQNFVSMYRRKDVSIDSTAHAVLKSKSDRPAGV
jgi:hypothetical protein